jgi:hypothetical protein
MSEYKVLNHKRSFYLINKKLTKHYPRPRHSKQHQEDQPQSQQQMGRGWYCKEHDIKYLCDICGHDNNRRGEVKYYFVSG